MTSAARKIKEDLSNLDAVTDEYDKWMRGYEKNLKVDMKTYARANSEQAGWLSYYSEMNDELEVMKKDMEARHKAARAKAMKRIQKVSDKAFTERLLLAMIEDDPDVIATGKATREIEERQKKMETIVNAFHQRGYTLNNMTRIRIGGFQDEFMYANEE